VESILQSSFFCDYAIKTSVGNSSLELFVSFSKSWIEWMDIENKTGTNLKYIFKFLTLDAFLVVFSYQMKSLETELLSVLKWNSAIAMLILQIWVHLKVFIIVIIFHQIRLKVRPSVSSFSKKFTHSHCRWVFNMTAWFNWPVASNRIWFRKLRFYFKVTMNKYQSATSWKGKN